MANIQDSYLSGSNIDFIEGLYARFLEDPSSVDPSWRELFKLYGRRGRPLVTNGKSAAAPATTRPAAPRAAPDIMGLQARVDQAIYAFRIRGHLLAQIDPLGRPRPAPEHIADLGMVNPAYFTEEEQEQWVYSNG
ncbi:MAG TPA: 2-oxoglutarate dehydrogenase E1 component, partial [Myxococcaceae bacterium]|nr:2-oxoglutarate dehydrogenase E1 component [Myxococcaceae bacterium]